ncbi:MAG: carboxypeptidase regulatory-like domain-containing protein [Candidatus Hydrogenedentes bacterium]|nr:carboxypeptidase regulatory-like domain-containing protein [Candidatus Hydrogenedentota bacterium]
MGRMRWWVLGACISLGLLLGVCGYLRYVSPGTVSGLGHVTGPPASQIMSPRSSELSARPAASAPVAEEVAQTPEPVKGEGAILGRVYDYEGRVASGARLVLRRSTDGDSGSKSGDRANELLSSDSSEDENAGETDDRGEFAFVELPLGLYSVMATREKGYAQSTVRLTSANLTERLTLVMELGLPLGGTVMTSEGQPIAGAQLLPLKHDGDQLNPPKAGLLRVQSNERGEFLFEHLSLGAWELYVEAAGYGSLGTAPIVAGTTNAKVVLGPPSEISGKTLVETTGEGVADITIMARHEEITSLVRRTVSGEGGHFEFIALVPGKQRLSVENHKFVLVNATVDLVVKAADTVSNLELRLAEGGKVSGRVYDADTGEGVAEVNVRANPPQRGGWPAKLARTDNLGQYELRPLAAGDYDLVADVRGTSGFSKVETGGPKARRRVSVALSDSLENVDLEVRRGIIVSGMVVDSEKQPVAKAKVDGHASGGGHQDSALSDESGRFALAGFEVGNEVYLSATTPDLTSEKVGPLLVPAEGIQDVEVVLEHKRDGLISGQVVDRTGRGLKGNIGAKPLDTNYEHALWPLGRMDGAGNFLLIGVPAGNYELEVAVMGMRMQRRPVQSVALLPGQEIRGLRLVVNAETLLQISGQVKDSRGQAIAHAQVMGVQGTTPGAYANVQPVQSDNMGRFRLTGLSPGTYTLIARVEGFGEGGISDIAAGSENVDIVLPAQPKIEGQVINARTRQPITEFRVALVRSGASGANLVSEGTFRNIGNPEGRFSIPVEPGDYALAVRATGYRATSVPVGPIREGDNPADVIVGLAEGTITVEGVVRNHQGAVIAGAEILVGLPPQVGPIGTAIARSDESGTFQLMNLEEQATLLTAVHPEQGIGMAWVQPQAGTVQNVEIVIGPEGLIEGTVVAGGQGIARAIVNLRREGVPMVTATTDDNGHYAFHRQFPGEVTVEAYQPGTSEIRPVEQRAIVESGQTTAVDFELGEHPSE